jgi:hypothetical protein
LAEGVGVMSKESWGRLFLVFVCAWICIICAQLLSTLGIVGRIDLCIFWYIALGISVGIWLARGIGKLLERRR